MNPVQVSLDGDRELHDKSASPHSGEKTFDKIVDNINLLLKQGTHVNIRLNLDRRTLPPIPTADNRTEEPEGHPRRAQCQHLRQPLHDNVAEVDTTDFSGFQWSFPPRSSPWA